MNMRIVKLYLLTALLSALLLAGTACQTAQRPAALLPPSQANAPAPKAVSPPPVPASTAQAPHPSPAPVQQAKSAKPKPDPVADLIAQVEKEYQAGQDNYKAGRLEAAKQNFERALGLLGSPEYALSDNRLEPEFDRVLEALNSPGLQPTEDDSSAQKSEPAPIDEANEVTFPVDPNIKAKAEAEIKATHSDLPLMLTDPVASYINYFSTTRGRGVLERALVRGGRYHDMIQSVLKNEGVPQDLIYLAQAESGFHPLAVSHAGARGIWQFMASRARGYGLERSLWIDDRQDPEKSTRAAARHLKDLYNQFGDWYLAMAAYNSGPGTVQQAVRRTGYADFWQLYKRNVLPKETRNYVPIILAVTIMAKNPAQYGLDEVVAEKPVPYDTVKIDYPVDLRLVAECVDASPTTLQDLNPRLLRFTTPKDSPFDLHLPAGTRDLYLSAVETIPRDMRVWWRYHKVGPGDTLASLARIYRTTPRSISQVNHLESEEDLQPESKLIIPIAPGRHASTEDGATFSRRATRYTVHKGDTVQTVADNFGVPATMVRRWNHLKGDSLHGRRVVYVHLPLTPSANETRTSVASKSKSTKILRTDSPISATRHMVKPGETLTSIASTHHTTVDALKRDNGGLAILRPGMILVIKDR
jgi:membrane-bound lytic murein transglycosylase D